MQNVITSWGKIHNLPFSMSVYLQMEYTVIKFNVVDQCSSPTGLLKENLYLNLANLNLCDCLNAMFSQHKLAFWSALQRLSQNING